ncbi:hypothetical protein MJH12_07330, partial [bacterium]|nr:hypothetical protein [bacterium]
MSKITNEIKEIIIKSTLHEICKDGKIDDLEKEVLINLIKYLKFSKVAVNNLKREILKETSIDSSLGTLDPDYLIWSIERKLNQILDKKTIKLLLDKLRPIIFEEQVEIEAFEIHVEEQKKESQKRSEAESHQMPWEVDREERLRKEYEERKRAKEEKYRIKQEEYLSGPIDMAIDGSNWEKFLTSRINPESVSNLHEVVFYIHQGQHQNALDYLLNYSNSFNYDLRYFLCARIYFELNQSKKAKIYLLKAKESGIGEAIYQRENFIFDCSEDYQEDQWMTILQKQSQDYKKDRDLALCGLIDDLVFRGQSNVALKILDHFDLQSGQFKLAKQKTRKIKKSFYRDIYYGYYGPVILSLQILVAVLILSVCIFNKDYFLAALNIVLQSLVSGVPDQKLFISSF